LGAPFFERRLEQLRERVAGRRTRHLDALGESAPNE
jgi:hypothetical protein